MIGQTTHSTLLARLSAGTDPAAWREFSHRYSALILGFARRQRLQDADCEDILQEVMTSLTRAMPSFRYDPEKGTFRSYLKTVTIHAIHRRMRQKHGTVQLEDVERAAGQDISDPVTDEMWEAEWRQYHLRRAMETIEAEFNATDRAAFDAYVLSGKDAAQTAESLGISVDQVYQAKSRILRKLSRVIEAQVQEEG